ncbi:MAG: right-handed parallel beta-helix repeat-containing protein [Deltaproteobacteria bacterium]|nr:right-handed parallel beta-helix repeat-containing protein [Deltaproteobacteria bacterium]
MKLSINWATFALLAFSIPGFSGCGGSTCESRAQTFCTQGAVYWADSCGSIEEIMEYCACGCNGYASGCNECSCSCSQVGQCCDGCMPIQEGHACDDTDQETIVDICQNGTCSGWKISDIALPELPAQATLPALPEPVRLQSWTCRTGWDPVGHATLEDQDGNPFSWCQPPEVPRLAVSGYTTPLKAGESAGDRPICEPELDGTFPVLGQAACQPLGDSCPAETWPEIPAEVTGNRIYVLSGATNGDGTQANPYGLIGEAVTAAAAGDVVVIGPGSYLNSVTISKDLTLWGACIQQSIIDCREAFDLDSAAVIVSGAAQVTLRNLRISGSRIGVLTNSTDARVSLNGVWLHATTFGGVMVADGSFSAANLLVDSINPADGWYSGVGIGVQSAQLVELQSVTLENNTYVGMYFDDAATTASIQDIVIRNTLRYEIGYEGGLGMQAILGQLSLAGGLIEGNHGVGIIVSGGSTSVELDDIIISDTSSMYFERTHGLGIQISSGAEVVIRQSLIERNQAAGITVGFGSSQLEASDIIIRDTDSQAGDLHWGSGMDITTGSQVTLSRVLFERNHFAGLYASDQQTSVQCEDVMILDTDSDQATQGEGLGIWVQMGAQLSLTRGRVSRNRTTGIHSIAAGTTLILEDVEISGTLSQEADGYYGFGLTAIDGAQLSLTRGLLDGNTGTGIQLASNGQNIVLTDVTVRNTQVIDQDGTFGIGLQVSLGSNVTLTRGLFDTNHHSGILAENSGTSLVLEDLTIQNTEGDSTGSGGDGLWIQQAADVTLTRALFDNNRDVGIMVRSGSNLDAADITVQNTRSQASDGAFGRGLEVSHQGQLTLKRGLFDNNRELGVLIGNQGSQADISDLTILNTQSTELSGQAGRGLEVNTGAQLSLTRAYLDSNHAAGIFIASPETLVELSDISVFNTLSKTSDGTVGRGLEIGLGAEVNLTRAQFDGNRDLGIGAFSKSTVVNLSQVFITATSEQECAQEPQPTCPGFGYGAGIGIYDFAEMTIKQVEVTNSDLLALQIARRARLFGTGLALRSNPVGINIQFPDQDYNFLEAVYGLWMSDNLVNFDTTELLIPDPMDILGTSEE